MKRLILVLFCLLALPVVASHIVGGEFEIVHLSGNTYRVNLIVYFDLRNGNPSARDASVTASIFRKRDNAPMRSVILDLGPETDVVYTNPSCANDDLKTSKIIYTANIDMTSDVYNDPRGYYISWERCCRNYTINNVFSLDPQSGGQYAGQTFYLEFPPVVKNGQPFINSTPRLFPPLSDYACVRYPYYVDFGGTDDDNDSLVYSLVAPLNTLSGDALPPGGLPRPAPYPEVVWRNPYSINNIMGGKPDLAISKDGLLTVTPRTVGLFVFAVRCEEFRDGVKIGETRRDFQMLSIDCRLANPPVIKGKKLTDANYTYKDNMSVSFARTVTDADRCIEVQVYDKDFHNKDDNYMEKIRIRAIPLGFKADVSGILPTTIDATLTSADSLAEFRICFDKCPFIKGPFTIGIIAYDDACALPLLDTIRVTVNIEPPPNTQPRFITPNISDLLLEGGPIETWSVAAVDDDGDPLTLTAVPPKGVSLANVGMKFTPNAQAGNTITGTFTWDPDCERYDFRTKTEFIVHIQAEDQEECNLTDPATLGMDLKIQLPPNFVPIIDTDLTSDPAEILVDGIVRKVYDVLTFNVVANDADGDAIALSMEGMDFDASAYSATFPGATRNGRVTSKFTWTIQCTEMNLAERNDFTFRFLAVDDANKCRIYQTDTVDVHVIVQPPDNAPPKISVTNLLPDVKLQADNTVSILVNEQISVKLTGTDADVSPASDLLKLEMVKAEGNVKTDGYIFDPAQGHNLVESVFSWKPECNIFVDGVYQNEYTFTFRTYDDRCFSATADTIVLHIKIRDIDGSDKDFIPPNVITPNNDGCNDFFALEGFDEEHVGRCSELHIPNLPLDNCVGRFLGIRIFNRWGIKLFESNDRKFRWYAPGEAMGVYYYYLSYSNKEYKGTISVAY